MDKINGDVKVNDGGGLFDSNGLIDTLIVDCETIMKLLFAGNGIGFCAKLVEMVQKLSNLRKGVKSEKDSLQEQLEVYIRENEDLLKQLYQTEKGGT